MSYRDRKTGKFVSKSTWKRSKAQGGTRYVREKAARPKKEKPLPPFELEPEEFEEDRDAEYEGAFDSP